MNLNLILIIEFQIIIIVLSSDSTRLQTVLYLITTIQFCLITVNYFHYRTPQSILETQFSLVSKVLMTQLTENENTDSTALLKSVRTTLLLLLLLLFIVIIVFITVDFMCYNSIICPTCSCME